MRHAQRLVGTLLPLLLAGGLAGPAVAIEVEVPEVADIAIGTHEDAVVTAVDVDVDLGAVVADPTIGVEVSPSGPDLDVAGGLQAPVTVEIGEITEPLERAVNTDTEAVDERAPQVDDTHPVEETVAETAPVTLPRSLARVDAAPVTRSESVASTVERRLGPAFGSLSTITAAGDIPGSPANAHGLLKLLASVLLAAVAFAWRSVNNDLGDAGVFGARSGQA